MTTCVKKLRSPVSLDDPLEADNPPMIDFEPGRPGQKNATPFRSTPELFREFEHLMVRDELRKFGKPGIGGQVAAPLVPDTCAAIPAKNVVAQAQLAASATSRVYLVRVLDASGNVAMRVARHVTEPTRQFWREVRARGPVGPAAPQM